MNTIVLPVADTENAGLMSAADRNFLNTLSSDGAVNASNLTLSSAFGSAIGLSFIDTTNPANSTHYNIWGHTPPALNTGDTVPSFYFSYSGNPSINNPNYTQGDYTWEFGINMSNSTVVNASIGGIGWAFESSYSPTGSYLQTEAHLIGIRADGGNNRLISFANPSSSVPGGTSGTITSDALNLQDMSGNQVVKFWQYNKSVLFQFGTSLNMYGPGNSTYATVGMANDSSFQIYSSSSDMYIGSGKKLVLEANAGWQLDFGASVANQWTMAADLNAGGNIKIAAGKALEINGKALLAGQAPGYGTPTGGSYQASFAAGSITLANLAACVAQLINDLKAGNMPAA